MKAYYRIAKWEEYQHYRDRSPPWIKLHRDLLSSETWVSASNENRVLAIASMLLAAATENKIPCNPQYLRRAAYLDFDPDLSWLVEVGFIEIIDENGEVDSALLAPCKHSVADARPEERRGEKNIYPSNSLQRKNGNDATFDIDRDFDAWWTLYPRKIGKGHALKAYKHARKKSNAETLLSAAQLFAHECKGRDPKFIPHPATWLNGERWLDEAKPNSGELDHLWPSSRHLSLKDILP